MTHMPMNCMQKMMCRGASAHSANAASSCAQSASNNMIALILDAIVMASIIICAILSTLLGASVALLVILAVLVLLADLHLPGKRVHA